MSLEELQRAVLGVMRHRYGTGTVARRRLMIDVEEALRAVGLWEPIDDEPSGSAGKKSRGLARIDWAISHLKADGRLLNPRRNRWRLPRRAR